MGCTRMEVVLPGRTVSRASTARTPRAWQLLVAVSAATACSALACSQRRAEVVKPLRVATYSDPLSLDPHLKNEFMTITVLGSLFETVVGFDEELRIQPLLAESWQSPDDVTWHFRVRSGVRFHDGRPLTAEGHRFTFTLTAWLGLLSIIPVWLKFKLPKDQQEAESTL